MLDNCVVDSQACATRSHVMASLHLGIGNESVKLWQRAQRAEDKIFGGVVSDEFVVASSLWLDQFGHRPNTTPDQLHESRLDMANLPVAPPALPAPDYARHNPIFGRNFHRAATGGRKIPAAKSFSTSTLESSLARDPVPTTPCPDIVSNRFPSDAMSYRVRFGQRHECDPASRHSAPSPR